MDVLTTATTTATDSAITCRNLTKDYGGGHGLFELDLDVHRGEVFGFIGANGAGKTTTMRLIMDLIRPDRGTVTVLGMDARRDSLAVKRRIGYLPGELPQFPGVRASHIVGLLAGLRGDVDTLRINLLAERLQLDLRRTYADLSHGNKQKVGLVIAFMHRPDVLILDEPTIGLDPLMQREVRSLVAEAVAEGATCLLSSHVLAEVELACDRIGLIRDGHLLRVGSLEDLRSMRMHQVTSVLNAVPTGDDINVVRGMAGISDVAFTGNLLTCSVRGPITPLISWLVEHDAVELDSRELSLEEVFLEAYQPAP